jgi:hypothetical protein
MQVRTVKTGQAVPGRGGMVRLRRQAGEVLRVQGADELGRGDLPVVARSGQH